MSALDECDTVIHLLENGMNSAEADVTTMMEAAPLPPSRNTQTALHTGHCVQIFIDGGCEANGTPFAAGGFGYVFRGDGVKHMKPTDSGHSHSTA